MKREGRFGVLRNVAGHKGGLANWRGGRGRSGLVSFETWQVTNEDSLTGGEEEGEGGWWASKRGTLQTRNHNRVGGGREEGGGGRGSTEHHKPQRTRNEVLGARGWEGC